MVALNGRNGCSGWIELLLGMGGMVAWHGRNVPSAWTELALGMGGIGHSAWAE